jgi:hypothetical protein
MKQKHKSILVGDAGQFFAAAELSRRGFVAALTIANAPSFDILATTTDGERQVAIQVKTTSAGRKEWMLNEKAENIMGDDIFYIFVHLNDGGNPSYHVVPSAIVAAETKSTHRDWLGGAKRDGSARKDSTMRKFRDADDRYLDKWELLFTNESHT